ncbi:MAG TPA: cobalamin biosynthesis protein [Oscillatoriaceae cyanobacterium M33_DOE_052]|uniref:Cobalamin biosynthesis protein CobD n=1 Tax=Planktothricoides sp. SpSt-374 TaxID=2282167 RepID=A0A7C3VNR7_9CYAN|nr:cobalamin biosynthesis protein [Oscillatoriaceae cyanobacterium M33_DOE_052]
MSFVVVTIAAVLDYLIGDPWGWPHPVSCLGYGIAKYTQFILKVFSQPKLRRWAGIILGMGLVIGTGSMAYIGVRIAGNIHPLLGFTLETILLASCFAGRSLRAAAEDVLQYLPPRSQNPTEIAQARQKLRSYVGRDTENLSEPEIWRAILETVAENAVDGVTAPLFYALIGAALPGVGALPLAFAYKAASTLDSMVGYKDEPFTDLGWFSAKLEDILTWLPCRLTVLTLGIFSGQLHSVWQQCQSDATKDPSPNSGWSECTYAVILGVQLGGTNYYGGVAKQKPLLGKPLSQISATTIEQALGLTRSCFLIWLGTALWCQLYFYPVQLLNRAIEMMLVRHLTM